MPRLDSGKSRHQIVVDWDGTATPNVWPDRATKFQPGFVEAMRRFNAAGYAIIIDSARLNPRDPYTGMERDPAHRVGEIQYMRDMLDRAGLGFIGIHTTLGKPGAECYIDDKGVRYAGRPGSWAKVADTVLMRLGKEDAVFPAYVYEREVD